MGPRGKIVGFATALQLAIALALPAMYQHLLRLPAEEARVLRLVFWGLVPLVLATTLVTLSHGLSHAPAPRARLRVLQLPMRIGLAVLGAEVVALIALVVGLRLSHTPLPVVVGLTLCTTAILALPPVPLYAFASVTLLPLALKLGDEKPPQGRRLSVGMQLGYGIVAVAWAALVPAAVFGAAQLDVAAASEARARAQVTAVRSPARPPIST